MLETCGLRRNSFVSSFLFIAAAKRYTLPLQFPIQSDDAIVAQYDEFLTQHPDIKLAIIGNGVFSQQFREGILCYVMIMLFLVCDCLLHKHVVYIVRQQIIINIRAFSLADPGGGNGWGLSGAPLMAADL